MSARACACWLPRFSPGRRAPGRRASYADFEKGIVKNLSLRSDGLLTLAPRSQELFDTSSAYLWALARDSKGNLYAGGGTGRQALPHPAGRQGQAAGDWTRWRSTPSPSIPRTASTPPPRPTARSIASPATASRKSSTIPRRNTSGRWPSISQGNLWWPPAIRARSTASRPTAKASVFFKSDETHVRSMAIDAQRQPDRRHRTRRPGDARFAGRRRLRALPDAQEGSDRGGGGARRRDLRRGGGQQAGGSARRSAPAAPAPARGHGHRERSRNRRAGPRRARPARARRRLRSARSAGRERRQRSLPHRAQRQSAPRLEQRAGCGLRHRLRRRRAAPCWAPATRATSTASNRPRSTRRCSPCPPRRSPRFRRAADGRLYAATGNVGKVYEIGPGLEREGTIESDVFDAGMYSLWGRLSFEANLNGGAGRHRHAQRQPGPAAEELEPLVAPPITEPKGGRVDFPGGALRAMEGHPRPPTPRPLAGTGIGGRGLPAEERGAAHRRDRDHAGQLQIPGAGDAAGPLHAIADADPAAAGQTSGARRAGAFAPRTPTTTTPAMQFAKGYLGARWLASDPNGDSLIYNVEIRGANETEWKPLKDKVAEKYFSWDSTAFPDGEYRLRVTASDAPANPPAEALTARLESEPFIIDNTPPQITRPGRHAQRRQTGSPLARRRRAEQHHQSRVFARWRRLDGGGAGDQALGFARPRLRADARRRAGRAHHRRAG